MDAMKSWPELLSPAGNFEKFCSALHFGADAVYLAGERFGMRAASDNFTDQELARAIDLAHQKNRKVYITLNVMPRQDEMIQVGEYIERLSELNPDGLIVADLGVFSLARRLAPKIPVHISTQAATVNAYSCNAWYDLGAKRVVLARELSLGEIAAIRRDIPDDLELETFVHGSMCVSFSGRCMLSEYFTGRDANRGECTQPCRWQYRFYEEKRPGDVLSAEIYPEGSYIFGSKDLCMIRHLKDLCDAGISSFKIEGRMKSAYYTALVTNAYRIALDGIKSGVEPDLDSLEKELDVVSHREYCTGYYYDRDMANSNFASTNGYISEQSFLCSVIEGSNGENVARCRQKNKFSVLDTCEFISPGKFGQKVRILDMYNEKGERIQSCPHPQMEFFIKTDVKLESGDLIRTAK